MGNIVSLSIKTEPTVEPVLVPEFKTFARIDNDSEEDFLRQLLVDTRKAAESYMNRAIITQTLILQIGEWPSGGVLELPVSPLQSVTHIKTFDQDNNESTFSSSNYFVNILATPGEIFTPNDAPAPTRGYAGIEIEYIVGYGDTKDNVPESIRVAIMQWATEIYENRTQKDLSHNAYRSFLTAPPKNAQIGLNPFRVYYL